MSPVFVAPLAIDIPWSPTILQVGGLALTWQGLFIAAGILTGVQVALWVARRTGVEDDLVYTLALIGVPCGLIGARLLFAVEHWGHYGAHLSDVLAITDGGLSLWGGIVGGLAGIALFRLSRRYPLRRALDVAAAGVIAGIAVGRAGDLVSGEHIARATDLPWGVIYTHPASPAFAHSLTAGAHHPAMAYELAGSLVILGVLLALAGRAFRARPGAGFLVFLVLYGALSAAVGALRLDAGSSPVPGVTVPQLVAMLAVVAVIPLGILAWRRPVEETGGHEVNEPVEPAAEAPLPPGRIRVRRA